MIRLLLSRFRRTRLKENGKDRDCTCNLYTITNRLHINTLSTAHVYITYLHEAHSVCTVRTGDTVSADAVCFV